jgi:anti-sigma B factor antagonist
MPAPEPFSVSLTHADGRVVVVPRGELDLGAFESFISQVYRARLGAKEVVIDLRELAFIDSAGLQALLLINRSGQRDGIATRIVRGSDVVHRVFELTRLDRAFTFVDAP